jgi:hypothetical protein
MVSFGMRGISDEDAWSRTGVDLQRCRHLERESMTADFLKM